MSGLGYPVEHPDCSWCGAEITTAPHATPMSRAGERFCSPAHRDASSRAIRRLRSVEPVATKDPGEAAS